MQRVISYNESSCNHQQQIINQQANKKTWAHYCCTARDPKNTRLYNSQMSSFHHQHHQRFTTPYEKKRDCIFPKGNKIRFMHTKTHIYAPLSLTVQLNVYCLSGALPPPTSKIVLAVNTSWAQSSPSANQKSRIYIYPNTRRVYISCFFSFIDCALPTSATVKRKFRVFSGTTRYTRRLAASLWSQQHAHTSNTWHKKNKVMEETSTKHDNKRPPILYRR